MAQNGVSDYNGPSTLMGLFQTADGGPVLNSGVAGMPFSAPAWSPDGSKVAFVDSGDPTGWNAAGYNWQNPPPGNLDVIQFNGTQNPMFSGQQTMVQVGSGNPITWPTVSPDGQWILYTRSGSFDTRNGNGDLYFASAVTPNQEVRLSQVDGDKYPFAAGSRDLSWNFEPSFAPVAAGGYFWAVFTSRRTYGNILTGAAEPCGNATWGTANVNCATDPNCAADCASICACTTANEVKQLWVVAIDQNPTPGVDPSHPAFHLEGQDETNLAMRGFMSLPPCAANGGSCTSGTDCCGGYCSAGDDGGAPTCRSMPNGCSQNGDKCSTSSDCCNASSGVTCIAHVCSEPTPQ
jgi:WD40-like Beta Propeller Repeat